MNAVDGKLLRRSKSAVDDRNDIDRGVGERLKLRRRLLGLTQERLAEEADLSPQQIHKYESGQSKLSATRLVQFSVLLDVDISWFFDGVPALTQNPDKHALAPITEDEFRLLEVFRSIADPKRRQKLIKITSLLAEED